MLIADKQKHCHGCGWCDEIIWVGERRGDQTRPIMMVISVLGLPLLWAERILYPFNQDALKASRCPSSGSNPSRAAAHVSHKQEGVRSLVSCACVIRPFKQNKSERASEWVSGSPSISFAGNLDWTGLELGWVLVAVKKQYYVVATGNSLRPQSYRHGHSSQLKCNCDNFDK